MRDRAEAVAYLRAMGLHASERDWALGRTIFVGADPFEHRGITVYKRAMYIVERGPSWTSVELDHPRPDDDSEVTLAEACARVLELLGASLKS